MEARPLISTGAVSLPIDHEAVRLPADHEVISVAPRVEAETDERLLDRERRKIAIHAPGVP